MSLKLLLIFFLTNLSNIFIQCSNKGVVMEEFIDPKQFKQFLRSRNNIMVLFTQSKSAASSVLKVYKDAAAEIRGIGAMVLVDCGGQGQKVCRNQKVVPEPNAFHHFKDGKFHKVYDRPVATKSFVSFMNDPTGDIPWDEDPSGKSVAHLESGSALEKILKRNKKVLVMFYAPWCGYCKQMKPEFAAAASRVKASGLGILAAMDVNRPENSYIKTKYNITGFPTVHYFKDAQIIATYEGENDEDQIVEFMKDPFAVPVKEKETHWSEEESFVYHLNDTGFDTFVQANPSTLVMFYAPWCGHCKHLKPEWTSTAQSVHNDPKLAHNKLAAVDATTEVILAKRFKVESFPTIKYFKDGEFALDTSTLRSMTAIIQFLKDPSKPPATPPPEPRWEDQPSEVLHLTEETFRSKLRSKKHALVMFYAPWCGHCKATKPNFESAAEQLKEDYRLHLAAVNCVENQKICKTYEIKGFPTFKYLNYYQKKETDYEGGRNAEDFVEFLKSMESESLVKVDPLEESFVHHLNDTGFDTFVQANPSTLVMFYAPWCGHCKRLKSEWTSTAQSVHNDPKLAHNKLAAVDATTEVILAKRFKVESFPTIKYFRDGEFAFDTSTLRSMTVIIQFLKDPSKPPATPPPEPRWEDQPSEVLYLTEDTFRSTLRSKKHALVMFYAPWCGHCKATKPNFESAAEQLKEDYRLNLAAVNCVENQKLCKTYKIEFFPTFKYLNYYEKKETDYEGGRNVEDFVGFLKSMESEPLVKVNTLEEPNIPIEEPKAWVALEVLETIKEKEYNPDGGKLFHLTDENCKTAFEENEHLFVFFYATFSLDCIEFKEEVADVALDLDPELGTLAACDMVESPDLAYLFSINSVPAFKYIRNGNFITDYNGELTKKGLRDFIQKMKTIQKDEL